MKVVIQRYTDPYDNLATEDSLLTHAKEDLIYLWRNEPSVIVGRNQNTLAETNTAFLQSHGIPVVRRLTGGGAVYQDLGNINLSYIFLLENRGEHADTAFDQKIQDFLDTILAFLQSFNIHPVLSGRNDICIYDQTGNLRKIAGTAMTQKEDRGLFHLCLLFDVNMGNMEKALTPSMEKLHAKGISSVRSRTINVKSSCENVKDWSSDEFFAAFAEYFLKDAEQTTLSPTERLYAEELVKTRYGNDEWTYGRNPEASFSRIHHFPIGTVALSIEIKKGKITHCHFAGDYLSTFDLNQIADSFIGTTFNEAQISAALCGFAIEEIFKVKDRKAFIDFILGRSI